MVVCVKVQTMVRVELSNNLLKIIYIIGNLKPCGFVWIIHIAEEYFIDLINNVK